MIMIIDYEVVVRFLFVHELPPPFISRCNLTNKYIIYRSKIYARNDKYALHIKKRKIDFS